ncbi:hypothetical protein [Pseudomonas mangrovi]|uniref:hypothetical protein n=1 Tax=Pseudomonas mangrovi TaxID=2161748 RepID=UPI000D36596A|nr:hypothetical protein [Pseudomonas mangrovi]
MINSIATGHTPEQNRSRSIDGGADADPRQSRDYQILRRTLGIEEEQPKALARPDAEPVAEDALASAEADVARFEQVLQQRELNVEIGTPTQPQISDPLTLDLAGDGFATRGLGRAVHFDLNADGRLDQVSMPDRDDALLALDRNGNGRIDDGRELFGDQNGAANGFAELARHDDNGDGRIDASDAIYRQLTLLRFDEQGRQQTRSLADAGVSAIRLQARDVDIALGAYDRIAQLGAFEFADGREGQAADLLLAHR